MLGKMVLKYRRILLLTGVITLSMLLIKGVAAVAAANVAIDKKASVGKVVWDSHDNVKDENSELFFKLNTIYKKNAIDEGVLKNRQINTSLNVKQMLASITAISLQATSQ
jgi:hypothetical protein